MAILMAIFHGEINGKSMVQFGTLVPWTLHGFYMARADWSAGTLPEAAPTQVPCQHRAKSWFEAGSGLPLTPNLLSHSQRKWCCLCLHVGEQLPVLIPNFMEQLVFICVYTTVSVPKGSVSPVKCMGSVTLWLRYLQFWLLESSLFWWCHSSLMRCYELCVWHHWNRPRWTSVNIIIALSEIQIQ